MCVHRNFYQRLIKNTLLHPTLLKIKMDRGRSWVHFAEFLREISRSFLRESSRLRIFVCGVKTKKEPFSRADLYIAGNVRVTTPVAVKNRIIGLLLNAE